MRSWRTAKLIHASVGKNKKPLIFSGFLLPAHSGVDLTFLPHLRRPALRRFRHVKRGERRKCSSISTKATYLPAEPTRRENHPF
jgi:hypothetical protein